MSGDQDLDNNGDFSCEPDRLNMTLAWALGLVLSGGLLGGGIYLLILLFEAYGGVAGWFCLFGVLVALLVIYNGARYVYVKVRWFIKSRAGSAGATYLPLSNASQDGSSHNGQSQNVLATYAGSTTSEGSQASKMAKPNPSWAKMEMV